MCQKLKLGANVLRCPHEPVVDTGLPLQVGQSLKEPSGMYDLGGFTDNRTPVASSLQQKQNYIFDITPYYFRGKEYLKLSLN